MSAVLLIGFTIGTADARKSAGGYAKSAATKIGPIKYPTSRSRYEKVQRRQQAQNKTPLHKLAVTTTCKAHLAPTFLGVLRRDNGGEKITGSKRMVAPSGTFVLPTLAPGMPSRCDCVAREGRVSLARIATCMLYVQGRRGTAFCRVNVT